VLERKSRIRQAGVGISYLGELSNIRNVRKLKFRQMVQDMTLGVRFDSKSRTLMPLVAGFLSPVPSNWIVLGFLEI